MANPSGPPPGAGAATQFKAQNPELPLLYTATFRVNLNQLKEFQKDRRGYTRKFRKLLDQ